jgi:5'-nucleotidase
MLKQGQDRRFLAAMASLALTGCVTAPRLTAPAGPVEVQILGLNDFHGNIQPSGPVVFTAADGAKLSTPLQGGAANLAAVLQKARTPHSITVAAGDLIGATPLESAYFLDEPTITALSMAGLELAAVGNHEFDKGSAELLRMQNGGCAKVSTIASRLPCRLEPFAGARFRYLAANVRTQSGETLFPGTAVRRFGPVTIGFIGMTLKDTATLVSPAGVAGLSFEDEAATANALVPQLKAQGADTVVLIIHQGGKVEANYRQSDCAGLDGAILPILDALSPEIRTVVSGHTHNAYACTIERGGVRRLLTSAGKNGYFATDIRLRFDPSSRALIDQAAANLPITGESGAPDVAQLVARYVAAAKPEAERVVGRLSAPVEFREGGGETPVARLIADAQLAATRAPNRGGAQMAFINASGVRASLVPGPDRSVTYGQIFTLQPFGNTLVVRSFTGAQLKDVLQQQFRDEGGGGKIGVLLVPSANVKMVLDPTAPPASRLAEVRIDGELLDPAKTYRVTINNFLASGGDGFTALAAGTDTFDAGLDLDATEAWLATGPAVPAGKRIVIRTARQ